MLRAEEGLLGLLQVEQHKVAKEEVEGSDEWLFVFCKKIFSKLEVLDVFWLLLEVKDTLSISVPNIIFEGCFVLLVTFDIWYMYTLFMENTHNPSPHNKMFERHLTPLLNNNIINGTALALALALAKKVTGENYLQRLVWLQLFFIGCNFFVDCNFFICFFGCNIFIGCNFIYWLQLFFIGFNFFIGCNFFLWAATFLFASTFFMGCNIIYWLQLFF